MNHVVPIDDLREHVTDGDPCPCVPRSTRGVVVHNSYDGRETGEVCRVALKRLGLALMDHGHHWTFEERDDFEHALQILDMHWPAKPTERFQEGYGEQA